MSSTRTYYTVETYHWWSNGRGQEPYWRVMGSGPGGKTVEEAYARIGKDMAIIDTVDLDKVKYVIKKTVQVEEVEEEVLGAHASFFLLKI